MAERKNAPAAHPAALLAHGSASAWVWRLSSDLNSPCSSHSFIRSGAGRAGPASCPLCDGKDSLILRLLWRFPSLTNADVLTCFLCTVTRGSMFFLHILPQEVSRCFRAPDVSNAEPMGIFRERAPSGGEDVNPLAGNRFREKFLTL